MRGMIWAYGLTTGLLAGTLPAIAGEVPPAAGEPAALDVGHIAITERSHRSLRVVVDGVELGTTPWEGDLEVGAHRIAGDSATFVAAPQIVTVVRGGAVVVELVAAPRAVTTGLLAERLAPAASATAAAPPEPAVDGSRDSGVYGGMLLNLVFEPGGAGTDICSAPEVTGCTVSDPFGGGIFAYGGYGVRPIGIDGLVGFQIDASQAHATVQGTSDSVAVPRVGALFAIRARWSAYARGVRFSVGAGVGGAARGIGNIGGGTESASYFAPAITADVALAIPVTAAVALSIGFFFWGENAGNDATVEASPLTMPVHVVASTQTFFLPFVGLEFGP
jgi:hypothetical protein